MTTEFESFSVRISTTDEGRVQPELCVTENLDKLSDTRLTDIVSKFSTLKTELVKAKFEISNKLVTHEVEKMKDWVKITVKSSDKNALISKLNELKTEAQL